MRILLHTCCGPCSLYPLRTLRAAGHEVTGFFYNPNIHPYQEYTRRFSAVREMADKEGLPMIVRDDYDLEDFLSHVASEPDKRCNWCYASRLSITAQVAAAEGFDAFTASLLYSRYQRHDTIKELGDKLGDENMIPFLYQDFRKGWQEGIRLSKELGLYRQQYCGCVYSEKERYFSEKSRNEVQGTRQP